MKDQWSGKILSMNVRPPRATPNGRRVRPESCRRAVAAEACCFERLVLMTSLTYAPRSRTDASW